MTKTNFMALPATVVTPEFLQAISNPVYSADPQEDGEIPYPDHEGLGLNLIKSDIVALGALVESENIERLAADNLLASRISALESGRTRIRIPDTGPSALKIYGASAVGSSDDLDTTFGMVYELTVINSVGLFRLVADFAHQTGNLVSSERLVEFRLDDSEFGLLAQAILSPISGSTLPRYIPVKAFLGSGGTKDYWLRVYPPAVFGGDAYFILYSEDRAPLTYAQLLTAAGISVVMQFSINFCTPFTPVA